MESVQIFLYSAYEDEPLRQGLEKHLQLLVGQGLITLWHDQNIPPGAEQEKERHARLSAAHIILLLVSADFLHPTYCNSMYMQQIMSLHEQKKARVIPIILRPVYWEDAPFGKLNPLPRYAKPITDQKWKSLDEAFLEVTLAIRDLVREITTTSKKETRPLEPLRANTQTDTGMRRLLTYFSRSLFPKSTRQATPRLEQATLRLEQAEIQKILPHIRRELISEQPTLDIYDGVKHAISQQPTWEMVPDSAEEKRNRGIPSFAKVGLRSAARSDPGIKRKHRPNEDSLLAAHGLLNAASDPQPQKFGLFVVADGMGGHTNGREASTLAIQTIVNTIFPKLLQHTGEAINYANALVESIQSANLAIHTEHINKSSDMGTTITAVLTIGGIAYVANVGDSRTYIYREGQGLQKVTHDHSVVASLVDAGIIQPDEIYTHPKRNQIYRSLGEKTSLDIDLFTVRLREEDTLLLCSDGLWDMVRDPQIEKIIKDPIHDSPSATVDALIEAAFAGGGEDNISVIIVQVTKDDQNDEDAPRLQVIAKPDSVNNPPV